MDNVEQVFITIAPFMDWLVHALVIIFNFMSHPTLLSIFGTMPLLMILLSLLMFPLCILLRTSDTVALIVTVLTASGMILIVPVVHSIT